MKIRDRIHLGQELRRLRSRTGLTLDEVAKATGGRFSAVVIGSYERGDRGAPFDRIVELLAFYGHHFAMLGTGDRVVREQTLSGSGGGTIRYSVVADGGDEIACDSHEEALRFLNIVPGSRLAYRVLSDLRYDHSTATPVVNAGGPA